MLTPKEMQILDAAGYFDEGFLEFINRLGGTDRGLEFYRLIDDLAADGIDAAAVLRDGLKAA